MPIHDKLREITFGFCLLVLLLAFVLWQANHMDIIGHLHDEGEYLMIGRLLYFGYRLYSEVFAVTPPLFLATICWAFRVWGLSVKVARLLITAYAVVGALTVALIARRVEGNLAGLVAVTLLLIAPEFLYQSRIAMPDVPAAGLAALSVLTAWLYLRSGKRSWLGSAGVIASASLLCKMVSLYIVPLLILMPLYRQYKQIFSKRRSENLKALREILLDWGTLLLSFVLPILICALVYDIRALYQQTIVFHLQGPVMTPALVLTNLKTIRHYLVDNGALSLLALCGVWWVCTGRGQRLGFLIVIWLIIIIAQFIVQTPLLFHHMLPLLFPLAILAGIAVDETLRGLYDLAKGLERRRMVPLLVGLVFIVIYLLGLPTLLKEDQRRANHRRQAPDFPTIENDEAIQLVKEITEISDFIITDGEIIAFQAGRNIPPILGGTSYKRIRLGYLTSEQLIAITQEYDVPVVMFWTGRFQRLSEYLGWVKNNYQLARMYDSGHLIYVLPQLFPPRRYTLGDRILFLGYQIKDSELATGGKLKVTLYWQALRRMREDYTVYLKLINGVYHVWGQQDSRPYWDGLPTNSWKKGQIVVDKREIEVLPGTPPGLYNLEVILLDLHDGETLEPDSGSLLLGPVPIPRPEPTSAKTLDLEHPLEANLGQKVRLLGYNIESGFRPGDNIHLTLFWQCLGEMDQDYTVFTHLVDKRDNIVAQKDNPPVDGFYPTTKWQTGEIVRDQYDLLISPDASVGNYEIEVGMYLAETGERLPVNGDDAIQLTEVTIAW
jgi:4-amino-4-deoxy-L-arabinose transferase-like glycosyltransferase